MLEGHCSSSDLCVRVKQVTQVTSVTFSHVSRQPVVSLTLPPCPQLCTDLEAIERAIDVDPSSIACVISTNCCFAPRSPESVVQVARICQLKGKLSASSQRP